MDLRPLIFLEDGGGHKNWSMMIWSFVYYQNVLIGVSRIKVHGGTTEIQKHVLRCCISTTTTQVWFHSLASLVVQIIILPGQKYCYPTNYQNPSELNYCSYVSCRYLQSIPWNKCNTDSGQWHRYILVKKTSLNACLIYYIFSDVFYYANMNRSWENFLHPVERTLSSLTKFKTAESKPFDT